VKILLTNNKNKMDKLKTFKYVDSKDFELQENYQKYIKESEKNTLRFKEYSAVTNLDENHISIIVKSDNKTIYNHAFKTNSKSFNPKIKAENIYAKLNDEYATSYHVISVFITVNNIIHPFKYIISIDNPADKIQQIVHKVMFSGSPNPSIKKLKGNKNFLDFTITKGHNIICRRFVYIPNTITDFTNAFNLLNEGFNVNQVGQYYHNIEINFNVSNELNNVNFIQKFNKEFNSDERIIDVKENIRIMMKSFKHENN
jgi:hypothetical protein